MNPKCIQKANIVFSILIASPAWAENWFTVDGTERPGAPAVKVFGLIQPTYQQDYSDKVYGLMGSEAVNEGKYPYVALIAPGYKSLSSFYLLRVQLGAREAVYDMTNYEVVWEYGANALTTQPGRSFNTELAEGSITFNHIPGARICVGLFKTPGEEEGVRTAVDYVNFTIVTFRFLMSSTHPRASNSPLVFPSLSATCMMLNRQWLVVHTIY